MTVTLQSAHAARTAALHRLPDTLREPVPIAAQTSPRSTSGTGR
jgi:hypothetical protein